MKSLKINNIDFPMCDQQDVHKRSGISEYIWTDYFRMKKLNSEKDLLWTEKGYHSIKDFAELRAEQKGIPTQYCMHSTRWYVLFNRPKTYVLYTNKLDSYQIGLIKFCLTHGIPVALDDKYSGIKQVFQPVIDLYNEPLFKKFKVESVDKNKLPKDIQQQVKDKLDILTETRDSFMRNIWIKINDELITLTEFYKIDKIDCIDEAITWYERYRAQEILYSYGAKISIYDLDKPNTFNKIIDFINKEGLQYGIHIKAEVTETTSNTYRRYHTNRKTIVSIKQSLRRDSLPDILNAYIQLKAYKDLEIEPDNDPNVCKCPNCGKVNTLKSARRNWELYNDPANYCTKCDTELPEGYDEESYEAMSYKLDHNDDLC